ncbi:MAG: CPBP family intramembrane glutamic endopeptidase [Polyangiales bacterium]
MSTPPEVVEAVDGLSEPVVESTTTSEARSEEPASEAPVDDAPRLVFWQLANPRFYLRSWASLDREAEAEREARRNEGLGFDRRPLFALIGGAVLLTLMEYFGDPNLTYRQILDSLAADDPEGFFGTFGPQHQWYELSAHGYWALSRFLGFGVFAVPFIWLGGERLRDQYLSTEGFVAHLPIYLVAFVVVLVAVALVSYDPGFQAYYPFYKQAHRSWADLLIWEGLYFLQFLGLELFFRGWWLKACKAQLGSNAIFAMVVPYVMIHYGKELPETLGAILAGVILGTLAMRTRSIWGGLLVHMLVAISMDVAVILQLHGLPDTLWPTW